MSIKSRFEFVFLLWIHKLYCVVKRRVWNVRIKAGIQISYVILKVQIPEIYYVHERYIFTFHVNIIFYSCVPKAYNQIFKVVDVELHPHGTAPIFFKSVLYLFVCIKLNFFLKFFSLYLIYSLSGLDIRGIKPAPGDHESNRNKVDVIPRGCNTTRTI